MNTLGSPVSTEEHSQPVTVLIADDYPVIRTAVAQILKRTGLRVVGEARNGTEAVQKARELRPDIVLMDIKMPDMDGLTATETIKREAPATAIVIFTGYPERAYIRRAIAAGAAGYLLKGTPLTDLVGALQGLVDGASLVDARLLAEVLAEVDEDKAAAPAPEPLGEALNEREVRVLKMLAAGMSNQQIAVQTHYSVGSVKNDIRRIMDKLDVTDRTQAAVVAVRRALI